MMLVVVDFMLMLFVPVRWTVLLLPSFMLMLFAVLRVTPWSVVYVRRSTTKLYG
jgi:hypothetical protein